MKRGSSAEVDSLVANVARTQHGLVTRDQAIDSGATERMIDYRLATGRWTKVERGVYRISGTSESWRQSLLAVCLTNDSIAASHRAGAALFEFPGFKPGIREFVVPAGLRLRRRGHRTLFDLAAVEALSRVEEALDDAVRRGLVTLVRMQWELEQLARNGRPGIDVMRQLLALRTPGPGPQSVLETRFLRILTSAGLPTPVSQHEIRAKGKLVAIVDSSAK